MFKRIFVIVLILLMFCTGAMSESGVNLGADGYDVLTYACTLPDGRIVFCGSRGNVGDYNTSRARLLCLNPDFSVSWEYFSSEDGMPRYTWGALLPDGTIGVVCTNAPYQELQSLDIRKFTQDGTPVGEPVDINDDNGSFDPVNPLCIPKTVTLDDGSEKLGFLDWNGQILFTLGRKDTIWLWATIAADDGLVLAGGEPGPVGNAKLMKVDLTGNTVWETVLPMMTSFGTSARIGNCIRTSDGGYLAFVLESGPASGNGEYQWAYGLVRFNEDGRVLWTNTDSFSEWHYGCRDLIEYDGKFVFAEGNYIDVSEKQPRVFHWFDDQGHKLGETSLLIPRQDAHPASDGDLIEIFSGRMFVTENGLWSLFDLRITDEQDIRKEMDTVDELLYRIPEL